MKFMLKQNIGMSVDIAVVDMNKIRLSYWIKKSKYKID